MIHGIGANRRRLPWPGFVLAGTLLVLVAGGAHATLKHSSAERPAASGPGAATLVRLGTDMTAPSDAQAPSAAAGGQVTIQSFSFGPQTLTVSAGTTVTWTNDDSVTHTVTAADGSFNSGNLKPGDQFTYTFSAPGTYSYHCSIHPFMTGQVVVQ
jgi:plastocyanin